MKLIVASISSIFFSGISTAAQDGVLSLEEVKAKGVMQSNYRNFDPASSVSDEAPKADTEEFHAGIQPLLREACFQCHGPEKQKGNFRLDTLDPDLIHGGDADWWLEVADVLSNGEMPPEEGGAGLADGDRSSIIEWLSTEIQVASQVRRGEQGHSSFRRMTGYEYNYALQDLLGLPYEFAEDLLPEAHSEDGFENSSEMLQLSVRQFESYRELGRRALIKATVRGDRPEMRYYAISMEAGLEKMKQVAAGPEGRKKNFRRQRTYFKDRETGEEFPATFNYRRGEMSHPHRSDKPEIPPVSSKVLIVPAGTEHKVDLGAGLPDRGMLRVRIRASRTSMEGTSPPEIRLKFGYQPTNDSRTSERVDSHDTVISAAPERPQFYQWDIPLSEVPRNSYRSVNAIGEMPNPTEYLILGNSYPGQQGGSDSDIRIDYLEIETPHYGRWPPASHARIFFGGDNGGGEMAYAREILSRFLPRAWRRPVRGAEIDRQLSLFSKLRPGCGDFQEAMIEVLAVALASPKFLYLIQENQKSDGVGLLSDGELATRLSIFLWCSTPDQELRDLAERGKLNDPKLLVRQVHRMLADPRGERFARHFVRQWLGMQLLDFLVVDEESFPGFDTELKEAMLQEPVAFFQEMLTENRSVLDFIHTDYTLVNERLARHYGLENVYGNQFRRVALSPDDRRGGLMTQAGLLAMNSDGKDSHPLKRSIWLLERLLNDPPPPPPPAVPQIDLADPEIAKLTLKERIEDHRSDPACLSCHAKIDPWGIAFENFDAVGGWRDEINGTPVDATSSLTNNWRLDGMDGLKRYLLANRQDQFCRAMVYKLSTFALGRPLSFADRSSIDRIAADLRREGDGLVTLITLIVTSDLFRSK